MRTIIAGSRNATWDDVNLALTLCPWTSEISVVISGTADGGDKNGERWAEENNISIDRYPADWKRYGKSAGMIRNQQMAKNAGALVAVWNGESNGTRNMIELARKFRLKIFVHLFSRARLLQ